MAWLEILLSFFVAFVVAIVASFLSIAWKRRRRPSPEAARLEAILPGHDCSFCGYEACRSYAAAIDVGADPALCAPGGALTEAALRELLAERPNDVRAVRMRAIVRCGGGEGISKLAFDYDNREDCAAAAALYGGPKVCKEGCLGFGSCAASCPLKAIRMVKGLAVVDTERCSGCGKCLDACPKKLIALVPAAESWYVACSSRMESDRRKSTCSAACDACGECVRRSMLGEFTIVNGIAHAMHVGEDFGADVAPRCPSGAIRPTQPEQATKNNSETPSEGSGSGL
jgi:Na+-translocating ferredoxin:NAD+ oxidoreductase subunit B